MSTPKDVEPAGPLRIELSIDELVVHGLPAHPPLDRTRLLATLQEALSSELEELGSRGVTAVDGQHSHAVTDGGALRYRPGTGESALGRDLARALRTTIERSWAAPPTTKERER